MNEIKTLAEIADLVDAGNEIITISSVWHDGERYIVMQDNTAHACYSVQI